MVIDTEFPYLAVMNITPVYGTQNLHLYILVLSQTMA